MTDSPTNQAEDHPEGDRPADTTPPAIAPATRGGLLRNPRTWDILGAIVVALVVGYLFTGRIGDYALNDPWEPRYPQTAREMMARGDYVTPIWEGEIRWAKPVLTYWVMMPTFAIFGENELGARLPGALFCTAAVLAVYFVLLKLRCRATAFMGAGILATTPMFYYMARYCTPDNLLASSIAGAMMFFALGRFGKSRNTLWYLISYACLALAFLAKGPVAGAIAVGATTLFLLIDFEPRRIFSRTVLKDLWGLIRRYRVISGSLVFLAVAGPWYIAIYAIHGDEFIDSFIKGENIKRFSETVRGLQGSSAHYIETIFFGFFPWNSMLPAAVVFLMWGKSKLDDSVRMIWYFMSWLFTIFLIFTFAGSKLDHYILPITGPFAVMVALVWDGAFKRPVPFWVRAAFLASLGFVALPLRDFMLMGNLHLMDAFTTKREIENIDVDTPLLMFFAGWGVIVVLCALFVRQARTFAVFALVLALTHAFWFSHIVIPKQAPVRTLKHYVEHFQETRKPESKLIFYGGRRRHTITWYSGGKEEYVRVHPSRSNEILELAEENPSDLYIVAERRYARTLMFQLNRGTRNSWHYLRSENPRYDLIRPGRPPRNEDKPEWSQGW